LAEFLQLLFGLLVLLLRSLLPLLPPPPLILHRAVSTQLVT